MKTKRWKSNDDYPEYAKLRADLLRDYNPANAREELLVTEIACAWRRLHSAREREEAFHSLTRWLEADRVNQPVEKFDQDGVEIAAFIREQRKGYDQVLQAIRDAGRDFRPDHRPPRKGTIRPLPPRTHPGKAQGHGREFDTI